MKLSKPLLLRVGAAILVAALIALGGRKVIEAVWAGVQQGAMIALVALGYTMVYGILKLINFAHSEVFMMSAFFGLLLTSALVGAVDAVALGSAPAGDLDTTGRVLASLYVSAPFIALGATLGATAAFLIALWTRARPRAELDAEAAPPTSDSPAGLVALVWFAGVSFVAAFLVATRTHHRGLGATALSLFAPVAGLGAFYLWSILRGALGRMACWSDCLR